MRYLVLSDIHGNLDALDAVMETVSADEVLILGDIVGYGAEPNAVIDRVRTMQPRIVIRGNHDKVACGLELPEAFNPAALQAAAWTFETLTDSNREWLRNLPAGPVPIDETVEVCHGSPDQEDEYLFSASDARLAFLATSRQVCFFGHTHVPACYWIAEDEPELVHVGALCANGGTTIPLEAGRRYLINPGAVGQPRDGNPKAGYAIYDSTAMSVRLERLDYPVADAQARILAAGLPDVLARRLSLGR
jgi:predicted phosphodiesterase